MSPTTSTSSSRMNVQLSVTIIICPKQRLLEWITPLWQACQRASCISKCSDFTKYFMSVFFHGIFSVATLASQVVLFNRVLPLIPPSCLLQLRTRFACFLSLTVTALGVTVASVVFSAVCSFTLLYSIPLYECSTFISSINCGLFMIWGYYELRCYKHPWACVWLDVSTCCGWECVQGRKCSIPFLAVSICCFCCCSVTKLSLTLCSPMECSVPGFPVLRCFPVCSNASLGAQTVKDLPAM